MGRAARVLVPAGIGDIYWIMVKLRAFMRDNEIDRLSVSVLCDPGAIGNDRSLELLEMVPHVELASEPLVPVDRSNPDDDQIFHEAFNQHGHSYFPGFYGYDWFICYNGVINSGNWLEGCDGLDCDWHPPMDIPAECDEFRKHCLRKFSDYMVLYFTFNGAYVDYHLRQFRLDHLAEAIRRMSNDLGLVPVFLGASWDLEYNPYLSRLISMVPGVINLVGQTTLAQAFGAMKASRIIVGYHSGLTNMGIAFGKPTVLLWPSSLPFCHRFLASVPLAVAPPETRMTTYMPLFTAGLTVDEFVGTVRELHG